MALDSLLNNLSGMIALAVALPFLIVALVFVGIWMRGRQRINASQDWPTTMGRVLASTTEVRRSSRSTGGYSSAHYPVVVYEYQVNGQRYQSNQIGFGAQVGYGAQSWALRLIEKYPANSMVTVYYHPENPEVAVLERTATSGRIFLWIAILIVIILVFTLLFTLGGIGLMNQFMAQFGR